MPVLSTLRSVHALKTVDGVLASLMKGAVRTDVDPSSVEYRRDGLIVRVAARHGATWIDVSSRGLESGQRIAMQLAQRGIAVEIS